MNDAGQPAVFDDPSEPAAWFQVVVTDPPDAPPLLPVQPFLACAADVIARLGDLDLAAIQLLVPSPPYPTRSDDHEQTRLARLAETAGWFANSYPTSRAAIDVSLETGEQRDLDLIISAVSGPSIAPWQSTVTWDTVVAQDTAPSGVPPTIAHHLGGSGPLRCLRLTGSLVEWSLDAVAWLAAFLGSVAHDAGFSAPILLTIAASHAT